MVKIKIPIQPKINQFSTIQLFEIENPLYIKATTGLPNYASCAYHAILKDLPFSKKMYLLSLKVVGLASILLGLRDIALRNDWISGSFEIAAFFITVILFYLFKRVNLNVLTGIFISILFPLVTAGCILGRGGLSTGNMLLYVILFLIMIATVRRRYLTYFSIYAWSNIIIVALAEIRDPTLRANYSGIEDLITSDIMIFTVGGIVFFLILQLTNGYLKERRKNVAANQELREKNQQVRLQSQRLHEMNEFKTKLFAILGHDMMSPLQGLSSILDFIRNKLATPEEIELMLPTLTRKVQNTTEIINNLFDWSRISLQNELIHKEEFLLKSTVDRIVENVTTIYTEKKINIDIKIGHEVLVVGDAALIETVIRNLIMNAIKYSNNNGVVTVSYEKNELGHVISVVDEGIGMSQGTMDKLFHFDVESTPGTKGEIGKGLGLFLCREFVRAHGGEIMVSSEVQKGSKFSFNIPFLKIQIEATQKKMAKA